MSAAPRGEPPGVWLSYTAEMGVFADIDAHIHVWRVGLDGIEEASATNLSDDEQGRAARYARPEDRRRFVAGRSVLRTILADLVGATGAGRALRLGYGPAGKPFLADDPRLHFNVSHSEGLALIAASRAGEVGIDIERQRQMPDMEGVARLVFTDAEQAAMLGCPPDARETVFYRIWTRKEALLKAIGIGLPSLTDEEALSLAHGGSAWLVSSLPHLDGYVAALARPRTAHGLRLWSWPTALDLRSAERRVRPMPTARPFLPPSLESRR